MLLENQSSQLPLQCSNRCVGAGYDKARSHFTIRWARAHTEPRDGSKHTYLLSLISVPRVFIGRMSEVPFLSDLPNPIFFPPSMIPLCYPHLCLPPSLQLMPLLHPGEILQASQVLNISPDTVLKYRAHRSTIEGFKYFWFCKMEHLHPFSCWFWPPVKMHAEPC